MWDLRTLAQFHRSKTSPGLLQDFMDGYTKFLRLPSLLVQLWFPIGGLRLSCFPISGYTCGFPTRGPSLNLVSSQFLITHMLSFTFPTIFPRTIAELLGTIPQRPREMTIHFLNTLYISHCKECISAVLWPNPIKHAPNIYPNTFNSFYRTVINEDSLRIFQSPTSNGVSHISQ